MQKNFNFKLVFFEFGKFLGKVWNMYLWISFSGLYNSCLAIFQHIESTIKVVNSSPLRGCPNLQAVKVKCPDFNIVAFYWSPNTLLAEDLENVAKGDLISKQISLWFKPTEIGAKSLPWAQTTDVQWSFFHWNPKLLGLADNLGR